MRYIGFKNFRKFENLEPLGFAPISIFVGGNNSGKSTVVKGLLTILAFLNGECDTEIGEDAKNVPEENIDLDRKRIWLSHNQRFSFNKDYYAHIGTCKRALRNGANPKEISFLYGTNLSDATIVVRIDDQSEEATSGRVIQINTYNTRLKIESRIDLLAWKALIIFHPGDPEKYRQLADKAKESITRRRNLAYSEYFASFSEDISIPVSLPDKFPAYLNSNTLEAIFSVLSETISACINSNDDIQLDIHPRARPRTLKGIKTTILDEKTIDILKKNPMWNENVKHLRLPYPALSEDFAYVYAHAVTQSVIYSAKDTNDYLVKTVHDFANIRISHSSKGDKAIIYEFIKDWMERFGIGLDYVIQSMGGEAHIVKIQNKQGDWVNMADLGMGSIQLMILLFRLGTIIDSHHLLGTTVILEEPEQNLHPKLQSKLADLLFEVNVRFGVRFIVETHSEYLIRKTQVIVGSKFDTEEKIKCNPFKVIYFPDNGMQPYDMEYTTSGKFAKPFGEGFFDEAANLHMTVLRNSRK